MVWYFIGVYIINRTWPLGDTKFLLSCSKIFHSIICSININLFVNTWREILYLQTGKVHVISYIYKITKMIYMYMLWLAKRFESKCKRSCEIMTFCSPCTNHTIMILKNILSLKLNRHSLSYLLFLMFETWKSLQTCWTNFSFLYF